MVSKALLDQLFPHAGSWQGGCSPSSGLGEHQLQVGVGREFPKKGMWHLDSDSLVLSPGPHTYHQALGEPASSLSLGVLVCTIGVSIPHTHLNLF